MGSQIDESAATELEIYITSDAQLYRQQYRPIMENLVNKIDRGIYDRAKAVKLFMYLMESGAKKYASEYSSLSDWNRIFTKATREHVAKKFVESFEIEYKLGNYENFHTKKYAKKAGLLRNPASKKKSYALDVILHGRTIDTVFVSGMTGTKADMEADVKRSLVNHDGYDTDIKVRRRPAGR